MIYFDNAATTFPKPSNVYNAINEGMIKYSFNAGRSSYKAAKDTFDMIVETRNKIASFIDETGDKVIFTSSATESLNNIIYGLKLRKGDVVFVSPFEHNAVLRTLYNVGVSIFVIPFDKNTWEIDEDALNDLYVIKRPKATFLSHVSNVTGFELPYQTIFHISSKAGCVNVLDCAQSFGIYPVNKTNVDFIVFAGHKSLYAMFGIAGYINLSFINLSLYKVGGTGSDSLNLNMPDNMPSRYEAGSMNSVGIYSINASIDFLKSKRFDIIKESLSLYLVSELKKLNNVVIYLPEGYIPKGIVSFNVDGYSADEVGTILHEDYDICVRTGYHCAPFIHEFIGSMNYNGTVRVSLSVFNTKEEVECLIDAIRGL